MMNKIIIFGVLTFSLLGCDKAPIQEEHQYKADTQEVKQVVTENLSNKSSEKPINNEIKLDTVEIANCAAAAMKSQKIEVFTKWFDLLKDRYSVIYTDKNLEQVEAYTTERILDKKRSLQGKGYDSKPAFNKYYEINCLEFQPK